MFRAYTYTVIFSGLPYSAVCHSVVGNVSRKKTRLEDLENNWFCIL